MDAQAARGFVREHGVVLVSARGPVPTLTHAIAGEAIRGSWWGHPEGKRIFALLQALGGDADILTCRLVEGKVTLVHRRLWPALAAAAPLLDASRLAWVKQEHTPQGHHENRDLPFPDWVPAEVLREAAALDAGAALAALGPHFVTQAKPRKGGEKC